MKNTDGSTKAKLTVHSLCVCEHERGSHHAAVPIMHTLPSGFTWWCIYEHCVHTEYQNGGFRTCGCDAFRLTATSPVKTKLPHVSPFDACLHCFHQRRLHCTAHRPAAKPKRHKINYQDNGMAVRPWLGFQLAHDHDVYQCQHFQMDDYFCSSSSCAWSEDGTTYCPCQHFISPWTRRPAKSAPGKVRAPRRKKAIPAAQLRLFPTPETTPTMDAK
jgi:hypothetical protein